MTPKIGKKAPQFSLFDQNNEKHSLKQYLGQWVILYFYPKDDTPGCTKEACSFRDNFAYLRENGIVVLGVSADTVAKHKKFEEKYTLPFTLLADEQKEVVEKYGVWGEKKFLGKTYMGISRTTFLIDKEGNIAKIYEKVKPDVHAEEILGDIKTL